jgi:hypothetical protein
VSAHKRHTLPQRVYNGHRNGAIRGWYFLDHAGVMSRAYHTEREARLAARQEANRSGFERRRELAQARQKAEEAEQQAREAGRKVEARRPGLLTILGAPPAMGPRGQGSGAIYGPIKQGTRQRTKGRGKRA